MMDQEPVLNLSDVVHDEPMDDEDHNRAADSGQDQPASIHETYSDSTPTHHLTNLEFSVEMLEREIATLLNQNASAASAALLNAAAQQRQAHLEQESSLDGDGTSNHEGVTALGLNLNGLAAVLQAAHAQAAENERVEQALAAKDPVFARQREEALAKKEQKTTRTTPAFHSLTASETPERLQRERVGEGKRGSDGSDYLYTDDSDSDREEGEGAIEMDKRRHTTTGIPRTQIVTSSSSSPPVPSEFTDFNDILHHLSSHFDPDTDHVHGHTEHSTPDASPLFSRSQGESHPTQLPILTPTIDAQPIASTSTTLGSTPAVGKRGKKSKDKDKGPHAHICDEEHCRKSFTRRSDLARHMRIHTGERPFVCAHNGCGKTFIQRSALHVHLRVHTGEKPHSCEYPACGKTFGDSSSLARHRRTHTGKRPYKCEDPECEKTFTRRTTLTQHMRTHDPTWEPDPNIKYNFKSKKRKVTEDDERELEESVRTISALFQAGANAMAPTSAEYMPSDEPLEVQVASISAEIAAAIAQAHQGRVYEDEEEEEDEESGSGQEMAGPEMIGPNTSGIRGGEEKDRDRRMVGGGVEEEEEEEEDDSDTFPVPLRTRKGKETVAVVGLKRKR